MSGLGALPARFRRTRLLVVGCGDVGQRVATLWPSTHAPTLLALTSTPARAQVLRNLGVKPLYGNLDDPYSLVRLAGVASRVLYLAPPLGSGGTTDTRMWSFLQALAKRGVVRQLVYGSTSGVYGDCGGAWVDELRPTNAQSPRAQRRVSAEQAVRAYGRAFGVPTTVLRIPGIYAPDRAGGTPRARLERGTPVLDRDDDVFTNHIHADDLARACRLALWGRANYRVINVNDDSALKMGDYMDLAATLYGLTKPARVTLEQVAHELSPMQLSFMQESRRLNNSRLKRELRMKLRYPSPAEGLLGG